MSIPELLFALYGTALMLIGITCLIRDVQLSGKTDTPNLQAWRVSLGDFFIIFLGAIVVQYFVAGVCSVAFEATDFGESNVGLRITLSTLAYQLVPLLLIYSLTRYYPENFPANFNTRRVRFFESAGLGLFYFLGALPLMLLFAHGWQMLLEWVHSMGFPVELENQEIVEIFAEQDSPLVIGLMMFMIVVMAPLLEELLYRGMLYRFLKSRMNNLLALTLSSLLFAAMHANLLKLVPLFLLGMLLGRAYEKSGSILVPIFMHAFFNLNTVLILLVAPDMIEM